MPTPIQLLETRATLARVLDYENLDSAQTRAEYDRLDGALNALAHSTVTGIDGTIEHLALMQSLLSQRGEQRKSVLIEARCPTWTYYAREFAEKYNSSLRSIQRKIADFRDPDAGLCRVPVKYEPELRLSRSDQRALVRAQQAANELAEALDHDRDVGSALKAYRAVAVRPAKLEGYLTTTLQREPDWRGVLKDLLHTLAEHIEELPTAVTDEAGAIGRKLLAQQ